MQSSLAYMTTNPIMFVVIYAMCWWSVGVPNIPEMHWSNNSSWIMVEFMNAHMTNVILAKVSTPNYVALTSDKVSTMHNGS